MAYFAMIIAIRPAAGSGGNGIPGSSIRSIMTLTSSPVTVRTEPPTSLLGATSWRVTMPSIKTVGIPFSTIMTITRIPGSKYRAGSSVVFSMPLELRPKLSWKPLRCPAAVVTWTDFSACTTGSGTGTGTTGPTSSESSIRGVIGSSRHALDSLGERDPDDGPGTRRQVLRVHRAVRVAQLPELLGVAQVGRRDEVEPLTVSDDVLGQDLEAVRGRYEPAPQVRDRPAVAGGERGGVDARVTAAGRERGRAQRRRQRRVGEQAGAGRQRGSRAVHGMLAIPSAASDPVGAVMARRSFSCW